MHWKTVETKFCKLQKRDKFSKCLEKDFILHNGKYFTIGKTNIASGRYYTKKKSLAPSEDYFW
jgi:hypothetical protein